MPSPAQYFLMFCIRWKTQSLCWANGITCRTAAARRSPESVKMT